MIDLNPWIGLIGAVIGGIISLAGAFGLEMFRKFQQARNLRSAFAGELRAILASADRNRFIPLFEETIHAIEAANQPMFSNVRVVGEMHSVVFRSNADKLGLLAAPLAEKLAFVHSR